MGMIMTRNLLSICLLLIAAWFPRVTAEEIPRTLSGKPDLSGNYDISSLTPWTRPKALGNQLYLSAEDAAAVAARQAATVAGTSADSDPNRDAPAKGGNVGAYNYFWLDFGSETLPIDGKYRTSVLIDPPDGQMPVLTAAGSARRADIPQFDYYGKPTDEAWWLETGDDPYDGPESFTLGIRCIYIDAATLPARSLPYNNVKTIVQTDDHVMIYVEWMHYARVVRLASDGEKPEHLAPEYSAYGGDAIGWWEGDSLVVETTNIRDWPGTLRDGLRIVERFTPVANTGLVYKFTVHDPEYVSSYTGEMLWPRTEDQIYEFACHEGNYAMGNMLRGSRMLEQAWREERTSGE
jgi:hypothetical protein